MKIIFFILISVTSVTAQSILPLQMGNKWFYIYEINEYNNVVTIDTIINIDDINYYNCSQSRIGSSLFRLADDGFYYYRSLSDTTTWVYYKQNAQIGDIWYYPKVEEFTPYAQITDTMRTVVFGKEVTIKILYVDGGVVARTQYWTDEFGMLLDSLVPFNDVVNRLRGCVIDGVVYGDTSIISGIEPNDSPISTDFVLCQNYPNPFNPSTTISYNITNSSDVNISIYDITGSLIKTLLNKEQHPGKHSVIFNASGLSSGTYFYRLTIDKNSVTKKMQLIK